jgi:hypothetical protein
MAKVCRRCVQRACGSVVAGGKDVSDERDGRGLLGVLRGVERRKERDGVDDAEDIEGNGNSDGDPSLAAPHRHEGGGEEVVEMMVVVVVVMMMSAREG